MHLKHRTTYQEEWDLFYRELEDLIITCHFDENCKNPERIVTNYVIQWLKEHTLDIPEELKLDYAICFPISSTMQQRVEILKSEVRVYLGGTGNWLVVLTPSIMLTGLLDNV